MTTKTNSNLLWWILGGGLLYLLTQKGSDIVGGVTGKLYSFSNPQMNRPNITLLNLNLPASIDITNNTPISPTINSITGNVFLNNTELGFFDTPIQIQLPPNGVRTIPFNVTLNNLDLVQAIVQEYERVRLEGIAVPNIRFEGRAVINGVPFDFNQSYTV